MRLQEIQIEDLQVMILYLSIINELVLKQKNYYKKKSHFEKIIEMKILHLEVNFNIKSI